MKRQFSNFKLPPGEPASSPVAQHPLLASSQPGFPGSHWTVQRGPLISSLVSSTCLSLPCHLGATGLASGCGRMWGPESGGLCWERRQGSAFCSPESVSYGAEAAEDKAAAPGPSPGSAVLGQTDRMRSSLGFPRQGEHICFLATQLSPHFGPHPFGASPSFLSG